MAADVGFVLQMMMMGKKRKEDGLKQAAGGAAALVTRDLLGGGSCAQLGTKELDLDLKVPFGWEKRLDMASGEVYLQTCTPVVNKKVEHDLNLPPPAPATSSSRPEDSDGLAPGLDLTLNLPTSQARNNLSVCTIEKVRSALERVKQHRKRSESCSPPASSSSHSAATSEKSGEKKTEEEEEEEEERPVSGGAMFAVGCPSCLLYVLICRRNPRCPRCDGVVPIPSASSSSFSSSLSKKPRLDLNCSVST